MHNRPTAKYGINFTMIARIMGLLLLIESAFMLLPLITCLIYNENDYLGFLIATAVTSFAGILMITYIRPNHHSMGKREGFLLTALVWIVFSCFGMLPFMLCETPLTLSDAFFESMSGFTTTGASVLLSIENFSHGIHLWRCLMQWIGGMGIILFTLAVIPMLNHSGGMQMFNAEVTGITHDKLRPRISATAKRLWGIYFILTVILIGLLWIGPMSLFDSICHSFSTISTGGFSTSDQSIGAWESLYVKIVVTVFMFLGGVNFALLFKASTGDFKSVWNNDTFRAYLYIVGGMLLMFIITIIINGQAVSIESVTIDPLFQIISTITSTGYTITNFENWGTFVLALVFVLMFFGACAGSTSGGAKIDRMLYLIKNLSNELKRCVHPHAIYSVRVNDKIIPSELVNKVIAFLCLYVILIMIGGVVLTAFGLPLVDAFFSSFSCISNTGLGAGITGYGGSYELLPDIGKWILSLLMLIGRLELFTVLILFTRSFWKK